MIAGIYARKSTDEPGKDAEDRSCDKQIAAAREFARKRGWRVDDESIFRDDGVSGDEWEKRPGLRKLLAALKPRPKFRALVVRNDSRLGRNYRRTVALGVTLEDAGVEVWSYQDGERILHQDDVGEMKGFIKGKADEKKLDDDAKNTREGQARTALRKHVGGKLYGYKHVRTGEVDGARVVTKRVVDPAEAKTVLKIFELRAKRWGFPTIANHLNELKIPAPRAASMTRRRDEAGELVKARASGLWSYATVGSITKNPHYVGRVVWGRSQSKRIAKAVAKGFEAKISDRVDESLLIVSDRLWREVQRVNKEANALAWRRPNGQLLSRPTGKHWITQYVRCGVCDGPVGIKWDKRAGGRRAGSLFCRRRGNVRRRCTNDRMLVLARAERAIIEKFSEALKPAAIISKIEEWTKARRGMKALGKEERAKLERERGELDRHVKKLVAASAKIDAPEEYKAEIEGTITMRNTVDDKLKSADVLKTFNPQEFKDAVEAVTETWRRQLKRDPGVIGQVLGKILPVKMRVTPPEGKAEEWTFDADVDYRPMLREASAKLTDAMEATVRELEAELEIKPTRGAKVIRTPRPS